MHQPCRHLQRFAREGDRNVGGRNLPRTVAIEIGTRLVGEHQLVAGGGADAYPMMRALLDALPAISAQQKVYLAIIAGPFMPAEQRREETRRCRACASTNDGASGAAGHPGCPGAEYTPPEQVSDDTMIDYVQLKLPCS